MSQPSQQDSNSLPGISSEADVILERSLKQMVFTPTDLKESSEVVGENIY